MNYEADTINELYRVALNETLLYGDAVSPRGRRTRELRAATLTLRDNHLNVATLRKLNYRFMAAEFAWMLTGQTRVSVIDKFNSGMSSFSDDGHHLAGAYGPPLVDQLPWVIETLRKDPDSRQAVLTIWRPRPGGSADVPCTVMFHFMIRRTGLELIAYMRSNDLWWGFPYDVFNFTMIQRYVAAALNVPAARYHHVVGSLHLYEPHWDEASHAVEAVTRNHSSSDLSISYPWPPELLSSLLHAPQPLDLDSDELCCGWKELIGLLVPQRTNDNWQHLIVSNGIEPRGWKDG